MDETMSGHGDLVARLLAEAAGCEDLVPRASIEKRFRSAFAVAAELFREAAARIQGLEAADAPAPLAAPGVRDAVEALKAVEATLRLAEPEPHVDPIHGQEIEALGRRVGFGTLISSASASWMEGMRAAGLSARGCFVPICHGSVLMDLGRVRAALARLDPAARGAGTRKCQWAGGNDISYCITCGAEHDYRKSDRPACPSATPQDAEATVRGVEKGERDALVKALATWRGMLDNLVEAARDAAREEVNDAHGSLFANADAVLKLQWEDAYRAFSARPAAAPSEPETGTGGGWQPIKTAPRDHFPVLAWSQRHGQHVAFLDATWAWWPVPARKALKHPPTLWRPLPASPLSSIATRPAETRGPDDGDGSQGATPTGDRLSSDDQTASRSDPPGFDPSRGEPQQ